jgi:hypothetical protein
MSDILIYIAYKLGRKLLNYCIRRKPKYSIPIIEDGIRWLETGKVPIKDIAPVRDAWEALVDESYGLNKEAEQ